MARLLRQPKIRLWSDATSHMTFLAVDVHDAVPISANVSDNASNPLRSDPMRDVRVRQALSLSIERDVMVGR